MMPSLVDIIEQHIRLLLRQSGTSTVELRRNHLADMFRCAPSQVSYVLSTRFTVERGYVVRTRRGGGGYVRIVSIPPPARDIAAELCGAIGDQIGRERSVGYVWQLADRRLISSREARLMTDVIEQAGSGLEPPVADRIRARVLRAMIACVLEPEEEPT